MTGGVGGTRGMSSIVIAPRHKFFHKARALHKTLIIGELRHGI